VSPNTLAPLPNREYDLKDRDDPEFTQFKIEKRSPPSLAPHLKLTLDPIIILPTTDIEPPIPRQYARTLPTEPMIKVLKIDICDPDLA
jgi:hypothetical protein